MSTKTVMHIVPSLQSQGDEVGEYALSLAHHLSRSQGTTSQFVICNPEWDGPARVDGFLVRRLRLRNEAAIWSVLASMDERKTVVLLHYTVYGYHKLGFPLWLYRGITSWLAERAGEPGGGQKQFATLFYEMCKSSGKPWVKEFYLRRPQQWLIERLHRLSNISATSTKVMQSMLEGVQPGKCCWLPLASRKGWEEERVSLLEARGNQKIEAGQHFDPRWWFILGAPPVGGPDEAPTRPVS